MTSIKPLGERVLIKPLQHQSRTASGIYLPESDDKKKEGEVVDIGSMHNNSQFPVKKGDKIIYGGYSSEEFEVNGQKYLIIDLKDVLARIE